MPHVSNNALSPEVEKQLWSAFIQAFKVQNSESFAHFLTNLLTPTEKIMLAKRLMIAVLLQRGYRYAAICHVLKVSKTTVNVIRRSAMDTEKGYDAILKEFSRRSRNLGILTTIERILNAVNLPVKGSSSSMKRWRRGM